MKKYFSYFKVHRWLKFKEITSKLFTSEYQLLRSFTSEKSIFTNKVFGQWWGEVDKVDAGKITPHHISNSTSNTTFTGRQDSMCVLSTSVTQFLCQRAICNRVCWIICAWHVELLFDTTFKTSKRVLKQAFWFCRFLFPLAKISPFLNSTIFGNISWLLKSVSLYNSPHSSVVNVLASTSKNYFVKQMWAFLITLSEFDK